MPLYEDSNTTREDLFELRRRNICRECHGALDVFLDVDKGKAFLACSDWRRTHHQGIERLAEPLELNIVTRREIMVEELGEKKATALEKYQGVVTLTRVQAMEILETIWPGAPEVEVKKAAIICHQYGLNPLMKHLFLIPFKKMNRKGEVIGEEWVTVMGISSNRLIARRDHNYSYLDNTPRRMTEGEQKIFNGEVDDSRIWALTKLKDMETGAEALGVGSWPADEDPYGVEKGNTKLNMACIRSEREALDRLYPADMPHGVEVIEERYAPTLLAEGGETKDVPGAGESKEESAAVVSSPEEKKSRGAPPADSVTENDIPDLNTLAKVCFQCFGMQPTEVWKELGYKSMLEVAEDPWECWLKIKEVRR